MAKYLIIQCAGCKKPHDKKATHYRDRVKKGFTKFYCQECYHNAKAMTKEVKDKIAKRNTDRANVEEDFWNRVDKAPGFGPKGNCWRWTGKPEKGGYGVWRMGENRYPAHRYAYMVTKNTGVTIPEHLFVCHECDNRMCVNPDHLWLRTHAENYQDMIDKGRHAIGEMNNMAKLTEEQVKEIKFLLRDTKLSANKIGKRYGVSFWTIGDIRCGRTWKHVII